MFVLDRLDATRLCARWSEPLADPAAWTRPTPTVRREVVPTADFSWRALARNPSALALTGMIGTVMLKDAVLQAMTRTP